MPTSASSDTPAPLAATPRSHGAPFEVLAPRRYQARAQAAYDDAELLLQAILPDAHIAHVGASAVPGAYSRGDVAILVAMPRGGLREAFGVLGEAGYALRPGSLRPDHGGVLDAPEGGTPIALHVAEAGSRPARALVHLRDRLHHDPSLLARCNVVKLAAAAEGAAFYARAKAAFIAGVLREAGLA